jgi:hypothetical protein
MDSDLNICDDRREFFRVEDDVLLQVTPSSEQAAFSGKPPGEFSEDSGFNLVTDLKQIDHDNQQLLSQFGHNNRDLELYLRGLNKKIDLIASQIVKSQQQPQHKMRITLSEGGLAFCSEQAYNKGTILAMQLFLLPSYVAVGLYGRVLNCSKQGDGHRISTVFVGLTDSNRQVLARQVMQVQLQEKRHQAEDY